MRSFFPIEPLKRYVWFSTPAYEAGGGSADIIATAETLDELRALVPITTQEDFNEVLDMQERRWFTDEELGAVGLRYEA